MDYATLCAAMGRTVPQSYVAGFNQALIAAQCTTVNRVAMFCAQTGHESGGLIWLEELASGAAYQGRADLGNTKPGFGVRYKGRGIIQLTGAFNYSAFSRWAHTRGLVNSPSYFYDNPTLVAQPPWAFISASYYWVVARTTLNAAADRGDCTAATRLVNGGVNGLADRTARWNRCRALGTRLLPTGTSEEDDMTPAQAQQLADIAARLGKFDLLERDLRSDLKDKHAELDQIRDAVAALTKRVDGLVPGLTDAIKKA